MNFSEFVSEIDKYSKKIEILENQKKALYDFMNCLLEKNKVMNLTAITDEKEIILKHFIDSVIIKDYIEDNERIIDIGTGAGFPGIPLKIVKENNEFVLLDSLNKRINFINEVIERLELKNIIAIQSRAEEAGKNKIYREMFDVVISRAVSKLNVLAEYMLPFLKVGGRCICLKGPNIDEELEEAKKAIKILGGKIEKVEKMCLPETDISRTMIIIRKINETPKQYPRKPGTPSNKPL